MNSTAARALIAQGVIGLAVFLGGYAVVVMPLQEKVTAVRGELAEAQTQAEKARTIEGSMDSVMARLADARRDAEAISRGGAMARSQEAIYADLSARAAGFGLRIDEFMPMDAGPGVADTDRAAPGPGEVVLRCRFAATGSYGELAGLLRALAEDNGFAAVRSVRLSPAPDGVPQTVHAEVETEHYAVDPTSHADASAPQEDLP